MRRTFSVSRVAVMLVVVLSMVLGMTALALAHVKINPNKAVAGAYQEYTVRVPNEGKSATIKVEVQFPAGLVFSAVQPKAGWTYQLKQDASQKVIGIIWSGGKINVNEYDTFGFMAKNPTTAGTLTFPSIQTYADGTVVNWTDVPTAKTPAPTVDITAAAATTGDEHGAPAVTTPAAPMVMPTPAAPAPAPAPTATTGGGLTTLLAGGALVISLIALGMGVFKK